MLRRAMCPNKPDACALPATIKTYLVGGAVRDELLGLPVSERDWVVVGATAQDMLGAGFTQVGKDFPVFIHPQTGEEYALARTERKTAAGHQGFAFDTRAVTLEEDLKRRDLTLNAIARAADGQLIDPYRGGVDLEARVLRHLSPAFTEDPLRVLRVARFAAQLGAYDFRIAEDTLELMRRMVADGELSTLTKERVWGEIQKALATRYPSRFFGTLQVVGAWDAMDAVLSDEIHLGDFFGGEAFLPARLDAAAGALPAEGVFIALAGQAFARGIGLEKMCKQLRAPGAYRQYAAMTYRICGVIDTDVNRDGQCDAVGAIGAGSVLEIMRCADSIRRPERWRLWLSAMRFSRIEDDAYAAFDFMLTRLQKSHDALLAIDAGSVTRGLNGPDAGNALRDAQRKVIERLWQH